MQGSCLSLKRCRSGAAAAACKAQPGACLRLPQHLHQRCLQLATQLAAKVLQGPLLLQGPADSLLWQASTRLGCGTATTASAAGLCWSGCGAGSDCICYLQRSRSCRRCCSATLIASRTQRCQRLLHFPLQRSSSLLLPGMQRHRSRLQDLARASQLAG